MTVVTTATTLRQFAQLFDHTLLRADATPSQIEKLCEEARTYGFKGVCVNPIYVPLAAELLAGTEYLPMAVVGFPLGANHTQIKLREAELAVNEGARELDMVINIGAYLSGARDRVEQEIAMLVKVAHPVPVKVIVETAFMKPTQIIDLTHMCLTAGAAFIKTSTGFGPRGASVEDIILMAKERERLGATKSLLIKASGGIKTLPGVRELVAAGADRVGSSSSVQLLKDFMAS
jgi:deoxyribose-phosphate aldolase